MKRLSIPLTLICGLLLLGGCATTESTRSGETLSSLERVDQQLGSISQQIERTQHSIDSLANAPEGNLKEAFGEFRDQVSELQGMHQDLNDQVEQMESESRAYLSGWQKASQSYSNEQLRSDSEQRREELSRDLTRVNEDNGEVNRALETYITELREIRSYLSNDLTQQGVDNVVSGEESARSAEEVRRAISQMQQSIVTARSNLGEGEGRPLAN